MPYNDPDLFADRIIAAKWKWPQTARSRRFYETKDTIDAVVWQEDNWDIYYCSCRSFPDLRDPDHPITPVPFTESQIFPGDGGVGIGCIHMQWFIMSNRARAMAKSLPRTYKA